MSAETVPFFCADCESDLKGEAHRQADGRYICGSCKEKLRQKAESKKQGGLFEEQKSLFNPKTPKARRGNVEGFRDANGVFHPIRASKDYNEFLAGDFEPTKRELSKRDKEQKEWERKELKAVTGASGLPKRSLASFVRSIGGMTPGGMYAGEVKRLSSTQTGTTGLINKKARQGSQKQTPEYVMDAANEEGYRDKEGRKFQDVGKFLLAVEGSATRGISKTRRRGPTRKQSDAKILAKAMANPKRKLTVKCKRCDGRGWIEDYSKKPGSLDRAKTCPVCRGKGEVRPKNPGMFGPEAVAKAKRVTKVRRVRHRDTGQLGEITGSAPSGWVKVKWDNRDKATLIKRSEIALARGKRNPLNAQVATVRTRDGKIKNVATSAKETDKQLLARVKATHVIKRVVTGSYGVKNPSRKHVIEMTRSRLEGRNVVRKAFGHRNVKRETELKARIKRAQTATVKPKGRLPNPKREAKTSKDAFGVTHENPAKHYFATEAQARKIKRLQAEIVQTLQGLDQFIASAKAAGKLDTPSNRAAADAFERKVIRLTKERDAYIAKLQGKKKNPSVAAIAEKFQGKTDGAIEEFHAASSAPANLARAGKLVFLKVVNPEVHGGRWAHTFRLPGAMVAIAPNEKLWIVSKRAPVFSTKAKPGEGLDVGEITQICYETAKSHIGDGKRFEYVHEFGEDGGKRPHLIIDHEGMPILHGGDYKIKAEGIVN